MAIHFEHAGAIDTVQHLPGSQIGNKDTLEEGILDFMLDLFEKECQPPSCLATTHHECSKSLSVVSLLFFCLLWEITMPQIALLPSIL